MVVVIGGKGVLQGEGVNNQLVLLVEGVGDGFVLLVGVQFVVLVEEVSVGVGLWLRMFVLLCQEWTV